MIFREKLKLIHMLMISFRFWTIPFQLKVAAIMFTQQKILTVWQIIVLFYCISAGFWILILYSNKILLLF